MSWLDHGARRPGESEAELTDRRGQEAAARAARHDAEIERHRREGTHVPSARAAGDYSIQDRANGRGGA
jgi:hypothetical protein